jgi:hypothetical protein
MTVNHHVIAREPNKTFKLEGTCPHSCALVFVLCEENFKPLGPRVSLRGPTLHLIWKFGGAGPGFGSVEGVPERGPNLKRKLDMKKLNCFLAVAAMSGLAFAATPASASPLTSGINLGNSAVPQMDEGMVQKVHGWHCRRKWSKRLGKHRHRRACNDYDNYSSYDDGYYGGYPYGFGAPFFAFSFDDDDHHGRRHHHRFKRRHGGHKGNW